MNTLCMIANYDCFKIGKRTVVREASYIATRRFSFPESFTFDLTEFWPLSMSDQIAVAFDRKYVHGMDLLPVDEEIPLLPKFFDEVTETMYKKCSTEGRKTVGVYAGFAEAQQLNRLRIPIMDLKALKCPMYHHKSKSPYTQFTCGSHIVGLRCGRAVVAAYRDWVMDQVENQSL